jgi:hypothetical protein
VAAPKAELSRLQRIMGHASPDTTSRDVHHDDHELAAEPRRSSGCSGDPLARGEEVGGSEPPTRRRKKRAK